MAGIWFPPSGKSSMRKAMATAAIVATLVVASGAAAQDATCRYAREKYDSAITDVSLYLGKYTACLQSSAGKDDCSIEFQRLRRVQDEIEAAVAEISSECRDL